ncbi:FAD-binding domain-containing protein [Schizosaccharomyces cryophilus OY26]|uniref:ferric-chelate reductase (NADPH) n=1 Tax=Schizosaccharomyces cryophilus (strain OY26 / ATCC MYA-4695 / CBS 11777 / NBRC 106824 / NRRL Y48691) TaxID=653667 RepID=S9X5L4_SCHCR|nr:FAD-binding domain-containing protein [Schizosaccharomyces cryophilus OY26]EPY52317.1 FAD-binding domain-containing protein [Schizosaccharomyces cryophilus OY26]
MENLRDIIQNSRDSHDKWAVIFLFLFIGCLFGLSGLYLIETARVYLKSYKKDDSCKYKPLPLEHIYLVIRNIYLYLTTNKTFLTFFVTPLVFAITVPFMGTETSPPNGKNNWFALIVCARIGFLSTALFVLSFFFSLKNNPFALMLCTSHEKMNFIHRRLSQFAIIMGIIHGFARLALDAEQGLSLINLPYNTGYTMCVFTAIILVTTLPPFRRRFYEWFFLIHHACSIGFIVCIYLHHPRCVPYMKTAIALYAFDRGCRFLRSFINRTKFEIHMLDGEFIYLRGKKPKVSFFSLPWSSGNHVYINIPRLSFWQLHPFTLASCPSDDYIELLVVVRKGFTRRLANYVCSTSNKKRNDMVKANEKANSNVAISDISFEKSSSSLDSHFGSNSAIRTKEMTILLDGPYGSVVNPFRNYSYVFIASGGCGITYALPRLRDLLLKPGNTVHITFLWSSRSLKVLSLFQRILDDCLNQNQVCVHMYCYLTASYSVKEHLLSQSNGSNLIKYCDGRPNLEEHIKNYLDISNTRTSAISACGSGTFLERFKKHLVSQQGWSADIFQQYEVI